jgi:hypothetical protein
VREIGAALARGPFACPETTPAVEDDDGTERVAGPNARHRAGALILMEGGTQLADERIAERLGMDEAGAHDTDTPVFDGVAGMADAQPRRGA